MSTKKKAVRQAFRDSVFDRDGHKCVYCDIREDLDAHHITDRTLMPNGGYCKENGITLCKVHHEIAETFHSTGAAFPGYAPEDLYKKIKSSYDKAVAASERLK